MNKGFYRLLLLILASTSCVQQKSDSAPPPQELIFKVDPARIGALYADSSAGFQFHPPGLWLPVTAELLEKVATTVSQPMQSQEIDFRPLAFFLNSKIGTALSISRITSKSDTLRAQFDSHYADLLKASFATAELKSGTFIKDDINFTQFLIQTEKTVHFKLWCENNSGQIIQFDYIVPKSQYANEVKAIESSIGTIKRIN